MPETHRYLSLPFTIVLFLVDKKPFNYAAIHLAGRDIKKAPVSNFYKTRIQGPLSARPELSVFNCLRASC